MSTETAAQDTAGQTGPGRAYVFAINGVRPAERRNLASRWLRPSMAETYAYMEAPPPRQRTSRRGRQPYTVASPDEFRLARFSDQELLHTVYQILKAEGGPGPGTDGLTYDDFAPAEIHAALRAVGESLRSRTYLPYPTRLVRRPKGDGRWRELQLQRITDRTVAKALQVCLDGYRRAHLPGIGRGVWRIYAQMERAMRERRGYVLAIDDIRDCFPTTPLNAVMEAHRQHIRQPDLLWLVETIIRGNDGPEHAVGLDQGSPTSPAALELTLHTRLDARLEAEQRGLPLLWRYVDNLTYVCSSEREGHQALQATGDILAELNMQLKGQDGPPWDIRDRDYDRVDLGLIPRW
jgi:RNA-directed DNA polymerase